MVWYCCGAQGVGFAWGREVWGGAAAVAVKVGCWWLRRWRCGEQGEGMRNGGESAAVAAVVVVVVELGVLGGVSGGAGDRGWWW